MRIRNLVPNEMAPEFQSVLLRKRWVFRFLRKVVRCFIKKNTWFLVPVLVTCACDAKDAPHGQLEPEALAEVTVRSGLPTELDDGGLGETLEVAQVVVCSLRSRDATELLQEASVRYRDGDFAGAEACVSIAADVAPSLVAAHHLRAAALTGLARYEEAQVAFAMALALDPNDPETLADAADLYINIMPTKQRESMLLGLQYAQHGSSLATTLDPDLRGRLFLLESEAHTDLGAPTLALLRAQEALRVSPGLVAAEHQIAVSLFRLLRFDDSEQMFLRVLATANEDSYAYHHLGLIYERHGKQQDARQMFSHARRLNPDAFPVPVTLHPKEFRKEVDAAIKELPVPEATLLKRVSLELADVPSINDLAASSPPFSPTILGLYRGAPVGAAGEEAKRPMPPRAIVLYRQNLRRIARSRSELNEQIRHTLRHELGHAQGLSESELRRRGLD